jgi:dihydroorotate dehydrogenase
MFILVPDLSVNLGKIKLDNPIFTASGTFGYGEEYQEFVNLNHLGGIVTKSITLPITLYIAPIHHTQVLI